MKFDLKYKKVLSSFLTALFYLNNTHAQHFDFNNKCRIAYNTIFALKIADGRRVLEAEKKNGKENLIIPYLENYADFLEVYATDTRKSFESLYKNKEVRLTQLNAGDPSSPYYLYTQAEVNLQWAALSIKFGEYMNAIFEIRKAFKLLEENQKRYPDFKPNKKSLGVLYALIGSVPDKYKWGLNLLGMEGSVARGLGYLEELLNYAESNDFIFKDETVIYYSLLQFQLQNEKDKAWQTLLRFGFPKPDNLLTVYACAHIGIYGTHNDEAVEILEKLKPNSAFISFPLLNYLAGLGKLHRLEPDADNYFKQFLVMNAGENHIKSSYQKIAWCYLLKDDSVNYVHFMQKAENMGSSMLEADKQAFREAELNKKPNVILLRARLLSDGNYLQRAATELSSITENQFKTIEEKTEYLYRLGRIFHAQSKEDSALIYYSKAIERGKLLPRYFAANSAYESGKIYESEKQTDKAKMFYELCLSFENHEYKNGLDQKAKAGLNRLK